MRRRTDNAPTDRVPSVGYWILDAIAMVVLGVILALVFASSGAKAGITLDATITDPLTGSVTYQQALERIQYAGASPYIITMNKSGGGTIKASLHGQQDWMQYIRASDGYRLKGKFTLYVRSRVFASGFEQ